MKAHSVFSKSIKTFDKKCILWTVVSKPNKFIKKNINNWTQTLDSLEIEKSLSLIVCKKQLNWL
jgi:hypothetical protein